MESSAEEWGARAKDFFDREQFAQARRAYEKASLPRAAAVANAYHLREIARNCSAGPSRTLPERRMDAFTKAAEAFLCCAEEAAQTPEDYYRAAAGCFEKAGDSPAGALIYLAKAARTYLLAKCFKNAAQLFKKAGMFDEANEVITKYTGKAEERVAAQIEDVQYFTREHTSDVVSEPLGEGGEYDTADHIDDNLYEDPTEYDADPNIVIEDISQEVASTPSVEELHAACILRRAFRRCFTRQKERKRRGLAGHCLHFIAMCLDVVKDKWERSRHKFYFLGPLPHVLACLHAVLAKKKENEETAPTSTPS